MERSARKWPPEQVAVEVRRSLANPVHQLRTHAGRTWRNAFPRTRSGREPLLLPATGVSARLFRAYVPMSRWVSTGSRLIFSPNAPLRGRALIHEPSEADVVDQPQCQKKRPDTGTAKTHKGQRDTGHRHESRYHSHIDKNVEQQQGCHPHT